jgi:hypothetical protein
MDGDRFSDRAQKSVGTSQIRNENASRKMRAVTRCAKKQTRQRNATPVGEADFSDPESQRVFDAAARALARELGRQAGYEWFDQMVRKESRS